MLGFFWVDVDHEGGLVFDPAIMTIVFLFVAATWPSRLAVQNFDCLGLWFGGVVARGRAFPASTENGKMLRYTLSLSSMVGISSWVTEYWICGGFHF